MAVRKVIGRTSANFWFSNETKTHYSFLTIMGGSVSGMRNFAKKFDKKQSAQAGWKYQFLAIGYKDGHYFIGETK